MDQSVLVLFPFWTGIRTRLVWLDHLQSGLEYGHRTSVWFRWVLVCFYMNIILYSSGFLGFSLVLHSCITVLVCVSYDPAFCTMRIWNRFNVFVTLANFWYVRETIFLRPLRRNNTFPALPKFASSSSKILED